MTEPSGPKPARAAAARSPRRKHKAEAARVLAAGLSASAMLGLVAELAAHNPATAASIDFTAATPTAPPATAPVPVTVYEVVVRHHAAPVGGSSTATSGSRRSTTVSPATASPAPPPPPSPMATPSPKPVTKSGGSAPN